MSTLTIKKSSHENLSNNWRNQTNVITHNDVLDAYLAGKEAGKTEQQRVNQSLFDSNLEKAKELSEKLYLEISELGFDLKAIHLKADSITSFNALFIADTSDFLNDKFREAFIAARKSKIKNESHTFFISFTFTPNSKTLDESCLASDGYFIKYYDEK